MFWNDGAVDSVGGRIALYVCLTFGVLFALAGALVLGLSIRHHVGEYHEMLARLTGDLVSEYSCCHGDVAKMRAYVDEDADEHGALNVFLAVTRPDGSPLVVHSSHAPATDFMCAFAADAENTSRTCRFSSTLKNGDKLAMRVRRTVLDDGNLLMVGWNVSNDERFITRLATLIGITFLLLVAAGTFVGRVLGRRFASPLRNIVRAADRIAAGDYSVRVPITRNGAEIRELEAAFNAMGAANEKTLNDLRLLTDDIAHDLRTPLTRLRSASELALVDGALKCPLEETVAEECDAMLEMINTMLDISRNEHRLESTPREEVDLTEFVRRFTELYAAVAEERGLRWTTMLPDRPILFMGHRGKLQRLFGNLLDNAVKFTPDGGSIVVSLTPGPTVFTVTNTGPGLSSADIPCVFRRFWRADASRSLPGNGLGLALVKAIVTSYGGTVECSSSPGGETAFVVTLPQTCGRRAATGGKERSHGDE